MEMVDERADRLWVPWTTADVARGVLLVVAVALAVLAIAWQTGLRPGAFTLLLVPLQIAMVASVFIFGVGRYRVPWSSAGFRTTATRFIFLQPWGVLFLSIVLTGLYGAAVTYAGWDSLIPAPLPDDALGEGLLKALSILVLTLLGPFSEETFFRGFALAGLVHRMGPLGAAIGTSLIFAAGHGSLGALVPTFVSSMLLCWLYLKSRSIWPCVAAHSAQNVIAVGVLVG